MKPALIFALLLAPALTASLYAQELSANPDTDTAMIATARVSTDDLINEVRASVVFGQGRSTPVDYSMQSKASAPTAKTSRAASSTDTPPGKGSMVGYIDDAVVGNQIRVRFDAAFDDNSPDRAEFFYAECGCDGGNAKGPKPGLATAINFQQLYMRGEFAPMKRVSFLVEFPLRWVQPQQFDPRTLSAGQSGFSNQAGISDVQTGFKVAALASQQQYLTFQFVATFPTGDSAKALGTHHYSIAPSLLYYRKLSGRFSVEGELGDWHPIATDTPGFAGDVLNYGIGPSYELYRGEKVQVASVVELVSWHGYGGEWTNAQLIGAVPGAPIDTNDGSKIVNLKAGFRTSIGNRTSFYVGFGQALSVDMWYKHILRLEYRRSF